MLEQGERRVQQPIEDASKLPTREQIQKMSESIYATARYLMQTFFRDQTWNVRQGGAYGFSIMDASADEKNQDGDKDKVIIQEILLQLGDRIKYFKNAYTFPDKLSVYGAWCGLALTDSKVSLKVIQAIAAIPEEVRLLGQELEQFLQTDAQDAFTIQVDQKTGAWSIEDVQLNTEEIMATWHKFYRDAFASQLLKD